MSAHLSVTIELDADESAASVARHWRVVRTAYLAPACWLVPNRLDEARFDVMARMFAGLRRGPPLRVRTLVRAA